MQYILFIKKIYLPIFFLRDGNRLGHQKRPMTWHSSSPGQAKLFFKLTIFSIVMWNVNVFNFSILSGRICFDMVLRERREAP